MPRPLTARGLAFCRIPSGHDTTPGPRCHAGRERISGASARDALYWIDHPECLRTARREATRSC